MEKRSAARELAMLSLFQLPKNPEKLAKADLQQICLAAIRSLADMAKANLKQAEASFVKTEKYLLEAELEHPLNEQLTTDLRAIEIPKTDTFINALDDCYAAIAFVHEALEIPELYWQFNDPSVQNFIIEILLTYINNRDAVEEKIKENSKSWDISRLYKIDKNILKLAMTEIFFMDTPNEVAVAEAVKLTAKYSADEAIKFVNGILADALKTLSAN